MNSKYWTLPALLATTLLVVVAPPSVAQPSPNLPAAVVPMAETGVTVQIINQTADAITYEALGDTQPRTLTSGREITLQNLNTPATLTFFYEDIQKDRQAGTGLLQASLSVDEATGTLNVVISPTTDLDADVSNIIVEPNGSVSVF